MTAALHGEPDWQTEHLAQVLELPHPPRLARHGGGSRDPVMSQGSRSARHDNYAVAFSSQESR
jgi:hypothetical protein